MSESYRTVAEAAKLLDEKVPGWYNKIDTHKLNMDSCYSCILGQLYGTTNSNTWSSSGFVVGFKALFRIPYTYETSKNFTAFCMNAFKGAWIEAIKQRKATPHQAIPGTMFTQGMADLINAAEAVPVLPLITPASFTLNIGADTLNLLTGANAVRKADVPALIKTLEQIVKELKAL